MSSVYVLCAQDAQRAEAEAEQLLESEREVETAWTAPVAVETVAGTGTDKRWVPQDVAQMLRSLADIMEVGPRLKPEPCSQTRFNT